MDFEIRQAQADEELYRKVMSILNKLTPRTFQTLTQQMLDLEIDTVDRLNGVTDLIYEKAVNEAGSTLTIANLCRCLLPKKVVEEVNGAKKNISFRKILLNRCQKEFEKEKSVENTIHEKLEELKKQGLSEHDLQIKMAHLHDEEKRRKLGNIRFIGELFKLKMLTESIMHDCVVKLLKRNDEESFECLCELLIIIGKDLDHKKAKGRIDQYFTQINKIIQAEITSTRVRTMMRAIVNLRKNYWVPQMVEQEKKLQRGNVGGHDSPRAGTIPQADETWTTVSRGPWNVSVDPKKFQNIKRPVDSEKISLGPGVKGYGLWARKRSGGTGAVGAGAGPSAATGSATGGSVAEADNRPANRYSALAGGRKFSAPARASSGDSWRQGPRSPVSGGERRGPFPQGEREKALEAVRAVSQPKRNAQQRYVGWVSPGPITEAALPAEPAIPGPTAATSIQELTEEAMKKKTLSIIDEYLNIRDTEEAADCLKELRSPSRHHVFVEVAFHHAMEKKISDRNATGKLMCFLLRDGVLTAQQYLNGLDEIFQLAEYIEIDIPQLWNNLGELMGPSAFAGNLNLDELFNRVFNCVSKHKAAKLFVYMLESATRDKSQEDVAAILSRYNVTLYTFFDNEEEAKEFAKDRRIEFALGQNPSSRKTTPSTNEYSSSARIQEEIRTVILKRKARNEETFVWIDKNVSPTDTKESPFIRALVTAVCEGAMDREEGGACKCNVEKLKDRKILLQRYIDSNTSLEVQAVYAVQALFVGLDYPPGFIKSYFDSLYDEEIITEESFFAWQNGDEEPGKGMTVTNAQEFFRWLKSAEEAGDDSC